MLDLIIKPNPPHLLAAGPHGQGLPWLEASYSIGLEFLIKALYKKSYTIFSFVWGRILMEDCVTLFDPFGAN